LKFDVAIIGAGAAGLFCAGVAAQRGLRVLLVDHSEKVAEKIRISGGGRCNFTNREVTHVHFSGQNPNFARSALARYTPRDFLALVQKHGIASHEKHKGQLFCDRSADDIIAMLLAECGDGSAVGALGGSVTRLQPCSVKALRFQAKSASSPRPVDVYCYQIDTDRGTVEAGAVVIATGGLSIPKIGATDFGYRIATQFGLRLVEPRPALVPLTFDGDGWAPYAHLAGLALPVNIETGGGKSPHAPPLRGSLPPEGAAFALGRPGGKATRTEFLEDLLFTHRGLSGPAVLQISTFWAPGTPIRLNLAPGTDLPAALAQAKKTSRKRIANELATLVPTRLADAWAGQDAAWQKPVNEASDKALAQLAERLGRWELTPTGTEGYKKAEVTAGGVDTRDLSSQTMESKQPGLYFIGEVVDVTGWLGGYNFQWAWASAHACATALSTAPKTL
jgi:predicted flavoprotein YhiN